MRNDVGWDHQAFRETILDAAASIPGVTRQADIARLTKLSPSLLSKWFSGSEQPSIESLQKIVAGFKNAGVELSFATLARYAGRIQGTHLRPAHPAPVPLRDPLARLLDAILDETSPVSPKDRDALRTIIKGILEPHEELLRRHRRGA